MLHSDTGSSAGLPFPNPAVTCLSTTTPAKCHREREAEPSPGSGACPRCALAGGRAGRDGAGDIPALPGPGRMWGIRGGGCRCACGVRRPQNPSSAREQLPFPLPQLPCPASGRGAPAGGAAGGGKGLGFPRLISGPASPDLCCWGSLPGAGGRVLRERMLQGRVRLAPLPRSG